MSLNEKFEFLIDLRMNGLIAGAAICGVLGITALLLWGLAIVIEWRAERRRARRFLK